MILVKQQVGLVVTVIVILTGRHPSKCSVGMVVLTYNKHIAASMVVLTYSKHVAA